MKTTMKNIALTVLLGWSASAFAAGGPGGGGGGGGGGGAPPVLVHYLIQGKVTNLNCQVNPVGNWAHGICVAFPPGTQYTLSYTVNKSTAAAPVPPFPAPTIPFDALYRKSMSNVVLTLANGIIYTVADGAITIDQRPADNTRPYWYRYSAKAPGAVGPLFPEVFFNLADPYIEMDLMASGPAAAPSGFDTTSLLKSNPDVNFPFFDAFPYRIILNFQVSMVAQRNDPAASIYFDIDSLNVVP